MKTVQFDEQAQLQPSHQQATPPSRMQPNPGYLHQQQVITLAQGPPNNSAIAAGQSKQVFIQPHPYQQGAVRVGQVVPVAKNRWYRIKAVRTLGVLQLIMATLSVINGIIVAVQGAWGGWLGLSIWSSVLFYVPAGILAIVSTKPLNQQTRLINACHGMSILSSIFAGTCMVFAAVACTRSGDYDYNVWRYYYAHVAAWAGISVFSFLEVIFAIVQAAYCCHATCACCTCCHKATPGVRVQYAPQVHFLVPQQQQNGQPQAAYPMQLSQLQQQQQQLQQQPQVPSHGVQNVTLVQNAPSDAQVQGNVYSDNHKASEDGDDLPKTPPPSYSLENNI